MEHKNRKNNNIFNFLEKEDTKQHFAKLNIALLQSHHIQQQDLKLFRFLQQYFEELECYYQHLYNLKLVVANSDGYDYYYLDFFSDIKSNLPNFICKELSPWETIVGISLLNIYQEKYFDNNKYIHWHDIEKMILETQNSDAYKRLLFNSIRPHYDESEWLKLWKNLRRVLVNFKRMGWIGGKLSPANATLVEIESNFKILLYPSIKRLGKLYEKEIRDFENFSKNYYQTKSENKK